MIFFSFFSNAYFFKISLFFSKENVWADRIHKRLHGPKGFALEGILEDRHFPYRERILITDYNEI